MSAVKSTRQGEAGAIKSSPKDEKSRSQIKRDFGELKDLGIKLAGLSKGQLRAIPLSEKTREAVLATQGMARNALQRHYRYLSSLLAEEDVAAIRAALSCEMHGRNSISKSHRGRRGSCSNM